MDLPSLSAPEFTTTLPSTGQEIKYRPFLVKEEKILLMALEGEDTKEINNAILKILGNCILSDVDVNKFSTFDVEYIFLRLRGKSVGEKIELKIGHSHDRCAHRTEIEIDLDEIQLVGEVKDGKTMLTNDIGVKLRYPALEDIKAGPKQDAADAMYNMITNCIEYIYDADEVYAGFTEKEIQEWIGTLNSSQFKKITEFFEVMPKLSHTIKWTCPECGEEDTIVLEGLDSFFT